MKKFLKWLLIICIVIISFIIGRLYLCKYISTKDISENPDGSGIKIFKHKNLIFKYGRKGDYPFIKKSYDGKNWEKVNIGNFWVNMTPEGFNYYSMNSVNNTIWLECFHSCNRSDCETYIYDYYYSNNNGENWKSLNDTTGHICYALSFKNDKEATCYYEVSDSPVHLSTKDGGKSWQEKN